MSQASGIQSGARYVLVNLKGKTAMDLSGADNKSVIGYPRHGGENQQWITTEMGGDKWTIKNVRSGGYLGYEGEPEPGRLLVGTETVFVWKIEHVEPESNASTYRISVPHTNQLDVDLSDYGNSAPGTPIAIYGRWAGENQVWLFEKGESQVICVSLDTF